MNPVTMTTVVRFYDWLLSHADEMELQLREKEYLETRMNPVTTTTVVLGSSVTSATIVLMLD